MSHETRITLIADYGNGDPASQEVKQKIYQFLPEAHVDTLSVPPFNTLSTGFWNAQLGLNSGPNNRVIYHNCAPRKDNLKARINNEGEGLTYVLLPNGVKVIGVLAGYTLSFIKDCAEAIRVVNVPRVGSQFRSRDIFPQAVAALIKNDFGLLGREISAQEIPNVIENSIVWVDGYGNLKTTISFDEWRSLVGKKLSIKIGSFINEAICVDGSFTVPEGVLAFAPGSSGWTNPTNKQPIRWMELFLRGGSAWDLFGRPRLDKQIKIKQVWNQEEDWSYLNLSV